MSPFVKSHSRTSHRSHVLYQGTPLQPAEKLMFLKGTAFRPYVKCDAMNPALAAEGNSLRPLVSVL
jgi:hypothetical protein